MLVSGVPQSNLVILVYVYIHILSFDSFHYRLLQDIACNSLTYTVNPIAFLFYVCESASVNPMVPIL